MVHQINGPRNGGVALNQEELVPLKGGPVQEIPPPRGRHRSPKGRLISIAAIAASVTALAICGWALAVILLGGSEEDDMNDDASSGGKSFSQQQADRAQLYDELGRSVLEDYDAQPPFSDFLPALAGYYGKPLYAFYVNRGQGIASFGVRSKDYPIMEFNSANKAYQNTPLLGFRTFIQGSRRGKQFLTEPFSALETRHNTGQSKNKNLPKRYMYVGSNEMQIQEVDSIHGIETNITYLILPEESFGAFVKRTTITNLDNKDVASIAMLDGLAKIEPAGGKMDKVLKSIGRTLEGWMRVYNVYSDTIKVPFFRLSTKPTDKASVVVQKAGHWCLSVLEGETPELLPIIYDTTKVFGEDTTLLTPVPLYSKSVDQILKEPQYGSARTSSAFSAVEHFTLAPGESLTIATFFGKADDILDVPVIARRLLQPGIVQYKVSRSREIINQITSGIKTRTADPLFDGHVQQMFLDNSLRGGIPSILGEVDDAAKMRNADEDERLKVYHLFSRIHGDLERDYNKFVIEPTFFSQGPVAFRDVAQNRRTDVQFNPRIGAFDIKTFLSFIQADGYGPLSIEAVVFTITDLDTCKQIAARAVGEADGHRAQREALTGILNRGPFRPGQLFQLMEKQNIELILSQQDFIDMVAASADWHPMAVYKTGYWADHFTYFMDLVDSYLTIYPDWEERIMFDEELPYFFSPAFVKPRREKYVLSVSYGGKGHHVRQLDATVNHDKEKKAYRKQYIQNTTGRYEYEARWQHDSKGQIFKSSPIAKLFLLATVKFATRDTYGMGIEYEGGRPGWDDANNGLVGMVGSGMPETYELVVLLRYILSSVKHYGRSIEIPSELNDLLKAINSALDRLDEETEAKDILDATVPPSLFRYWDTVASARENYRRETKLTFSGATMTIGPTDLSTIVQSWLTELDLGIERAHKFGSQGNGDDGTTGITPTYFSYNVTKWTETGKVNVDGHPLVSAKQMKVVLFPLFLEGPTRMMKTVGSTAALDIYKKVRTSPLRDEDLGMYTISASLKGQSYDMGREMAFAPGWLENQSVWTHMSYKFYLELIRHGLFDQFFEEMTSGGMLPFMDPNVYGRSLMQCSSFIASSAFDDPAVRGRGFLARLSGSTAEFLSMWVLMMIGPKPFFLDKDTGELRMQLVPALPRVFFDDKGGSSTPSVSFKLFGAIDVTYYNQRGDRDLFGTPPSRYVVGLRDGSTFSLEGPSIPFHLADKIRRVVFVASIEAYFV